MHYIGDMQGPDAFGLLRRLEKRRMIEPLNFFELRDAVRVHYQSLLKDEQVQRWRAEGIAEGRAEGIAEGRAEGRADERVSAVVAILRYRGMLLSAADQERLRSLPVERMPSISDAHECVDLADLFRRAERANGGPVSETERQPNGSGIPPA